MSCQLQEIYLRSGSNYIRLFHKDSKILETQSSNQRKLNPYLVGSAQILESHRI